MKVYAIWRHIKVVDLLKIFHACCRRKAVLRIELGSWEDFSRSLVWLSRSRKLEEKRNVQYFLTWVLSMVVASEGKEDAKMFSSSS